ncbi:MAG: hypothetical protein ACQEXN_10415 [Actinomycetota bacterium]
MSTPNDENPNLDDVMEPSEDAIPPSSRRGHGKMPLDISDDDYERAAEQERVAAGLEPAAPSDVPDATDELPPEASEEADRAQRGLRDDDGTEQ